MSRQLLTEVPAELEVSQEWEFLPQWLRQGNYIKGFVCWGRCVDIGTPGRYRCAQDLLAHAEVRVDKPQRGTGD